MKIPVISIFLVGIFFLQEITVAQAGQPVYRKIFHNYDDFEKGNSLASPEQAKRVKFLLAPLVGQPKIWVVENGHTRKMRPGTIYGVRDLDNRSYRLYHSAAFQILDTAGFYLYYRYYYQSDRPGKGLIKKEGYYFSVRGDSDLFPLTVDNLEAAFPSNHAFHYLLAPFRSEADLASYDRYAGQYKIKYLYRKSLGSL